MIKNHPKPRISAEGMTQVKSLSADIMFILRDRIADIAIDQCQTDIHENEEMALDEEIALEGIIFEMILQDLRREF